MQISVQCLNCGHLAVIDDAHLAHHHLLASTPLVTLTRRLTCSVCGSKAVKAQRKEASPPTVPEIDP